MKTLHVSAHYVMANVQTFKLESITDLRVHAVVFLLYIYLQK